MEKILIGGITLYVLFTLISYFLILLNIPIFIIPIALFTLLALARPFIKEIKDIKFKINPYNLLVASVFIIGIFGQLAVISPSGIYKNGDLVFWSSHGHDSAWHIALMGEIKKGWPFQNPVFAGERLVNYHFFSDILPAMVSRFLPVSDIDSYFRIFPFFYSLFLGASAYFLTKKMTGNSRAGLWATIFTYFGGSFGYLIGKGESVFWATQPQSSSGNPPQIISNFLVLTYLYFTISLLKKFEKFTFMSAVLVLGTISVFKVYAGIVLIGGTAVAGLWDLFKNKRIRILGLLALSLPLTAILYLPNSSGTAGFLIFQPWWYIRTMIVEPSRLNLIDWELRRQTYLYEHNLKRVIFLEGLGFLIFFFGNLGMRFLGILKILKQNLLIISSIAISLILPLLFLQKGVASNTSQFLEYFVLLFGILAGIATADILNRMRFNLLKLPFGLLIIAVMVPTQVMLLKDFYSRPPLAKISADELSALEFIKKNVSVNTVLLTPPYNTELNLHKSTPDIWDWFDTSYVSAFSQRRTYFDDYEQVDIMGYNFRQRLKIKNNIFNSEDSELVKSNILKTGATYVYFPKVLSPKVNLEKIGLTKIFSNNEVEIWKI